MKGLSTNVINVDDLSNYREIIVPFYFNIVSIGFCAPKIISEFKPISNLKGFFETLLAFFEI